MPTSPTDASAATGPARRDATRRYTAEECFANMAALWRHYGRPPLCREADMPPSTVGMHAYVRRSGSWRAAVAAFARFTGVALKRGTLERAENKGAAARKTPRAHPRDVPLGLRYQVLQRDRFRCAACGNSPAVDPACRLHVDHIAHWSRGGRTEPGNLRTLCAACNLGRGDRADAP